MNPQQPPTPQPGPWPSQQAGAPQPPFMPVQPPRPNNTRTILIVVACVLVIPLLCVLGLIAIAVPGFLKARDTARARAAEAMCGIRLTQIDIVKQIWEEQNAGTDPLPVPTQADLAAVDPELVFSCTEGGTYTIGGPGVSPSCSKHPGAH